MVEIGAYTFDTGGVELVDTPISDLSIKDQVGVLQHAQMLGHGWPANGSLGDLVDCRRAFAQTLKTANRWISEAINDCAWLAITYGK